MNGTQKNQKQKERFTHHPEFRTPADPIGEAGRALRDRRDALRVHSDTKHWR